ncbi:MAG: methionine--tRNA ligase subunit beta [Candidatus Jorgensenbacteria bacterium]
MISIEDFKNIELKVGKVLEAARVEGSDKLLKLSVDLGPSINSGQAPSINSGQARDVRQIIAGIGKAYTPEALVGKQIAVVANLEPRVFTLRPVRQAQGRPEELEGRLGSGQVGLESQGMLLAAGDAAGPVLLVPERPVEPGENIR